MIPFLVIYLHDVRGIGLGTSGAVVAVLLGIGVVGSPLAGRIVDRVGARATLISSRPFPVGRKSSPGLMYRSSSIPCCRSWS